MALAARGRCSIHNQAAALVFRTQLQPTSWVPCCASRSSSSPPSPFSSAPSHSLRVLSHLQPVSSDKSFSSSARSRRIYPLRQHQPCRYKRCACMHACPCSLRCSSCSQEISLSCKLSHRLQAQVHTHSGGSPETCGSVSAPVPWLLLLIHHFPLPHPPPLLLLLLLPTQARMPTLFVTHGGGPLPLLGDPVHAPLTQFLRAAAKKLPAKPKAILMCTAHWVGVDGCVRSELSVREAGAGPGSSTEVLGLLTSFACAAHTHCTKRLCQSRPPT